MDAIEAILTRSTVPQVKMTGPGPGSAELARILEAGASAPDHGRLRPWRFLVIQGEGRRQLGALFEQALRASNPDCAPEEAEKQRSGPLRAPLVIVVAATLSDERARDKIPPVERIASAAAAAQNMLLAAHAQGYAGKWSTGKPAQNALVRAGLGLAAQDEIIGFLYIGTYAVEHAISARPTLEGIAAPWPA